MSLTWKSLARYVVLRRFEHTVGKRIDRVINRAIDDATDAVVAKYRGIHAPAAPQWLTEVLKETGSPPDEAKQIAAEVEKALAGQADQTKIAAALELRRQRRKELDHG